jgi:Ca2+-binding RTX toxin-like protein
VLSGGLGDDTYIVSTGDSVVENANEGIDTVQSNVTHTLGANVENLTLTGTTAINGTGNALNNTIAGNTAANILDGGAGADTLIGGTGNDTYVVDNTGDVVQETSTVATEIDVVQSSVTYTLAANVENLTLTGTAAINGTGNMLNNILTGNGSDNVLDGGVGVDSMAGGLGNDTYKVDNTGDVVTEAASAGTDTVQSSITYTLGANLENLTLTGATVINGTGNTLNNTIIGNGAANVLSGGTGADTMIAGAGDDIYVVDNVGDLVIENTAEGTDLVQSSVTYTLSADVENLTLTGATAINGTGNALNNTFTGNSAANVLTGGLGDDTYIVSTGDSVVEHAGEGIDTVQSNITYTLGANVEYLTLTGATAINGTGNTLNNVLTGNTAANTLNGGAGADTLTGGTGSSDTYVVDDAGDTVVETSTVTTEIDVVQSSVSYTLGANLENLTLTGTAAINGTGNTQNNVLTGNSAANVLDGGAGNDTLTGGTGNDTYVVDSTGDAVSETSTVTTEIDTVQSTITYTLGANLENLTLTGTAAINGTGNTLNNVLTGNNAANTLNGGTGADTMAGGAGDDTYVVDNVGDIVTENANEGIDLIQSGVTYTLVANIENLTLTGATAINGTGNELNNTLTGNSAANVLSGGLGDDTYIVSTGDSVVENANEGIDTVQSNVTHTLGANVENLTLTGTTAINGTGNTLNNVLKGNSGVNSLSGAAGNDTLEGLGGADTLTGGTGDDTYILGRGYAADTVIEIDATTGNIDLAQFMSGVAADQIWFRHVSNNLEASIIGTPDKLVIKDWYLGTAYHVEQFKTTDGAKTLLDSQVQNLVNAMASFAPPAAGQTTLPQNYQDALAGVIAANWQ